ncbi:MAG: [FeFe] hydrogenase H-cluster radical SAM maturase HydE, partial [Clostridia bacterium]|nr:[FeFe] hydrogenase H-cluster radical SAM maturase HydE [Clostridia bacterium]
MRDLTDKLRDTQNLTDEEFAMIIDGEIDTEYLFSQADKVRKEHYGNEVYIRGLIEISNYCKNDCLYCGIRRSNKNAVRYRLTEEEILSCCENGYELGFKTFVMQGG